MATELLYKLGDFLRQTFFSVERKGEFVYPIVDGSFINKFCHTVGLKRSELLLSLRSSDILSLKLSDNTPIEVILGMITIQLYAASNMEHKDGFTAANYRHQICKCLGVDTSYWQNWVGKYQNILWKRYYTWCDAESFHVANRCSRDKKHKDKFVQYPKAHSAQVLNKEDLKRFAAEFVAKGILPNEDLSPKEFWRIIGIPDSSHITSRAEKIWDSDMESAKMQIFYYYLSWDGTYSDAQKGLRSHKGSNYILRLYQEADEWILEVCTKSDPVKQIVLSPGTDIRNELKSFYTFKWPNVILFEKDRTYDDYEEVRYLSGQHDDGEDLALFINASGEFHEQDVEVRFGKNSLVRLNRKAKEYAQFYTPDKHPYRLYGGLRISRYKPDYLLGAPPMLELDSDLPFYMDGRPHQGILGYNRLTLDVGVHYIKIPGYKSIGINIVEPKLNGITTWDNNPKWLLDSKQKKWSIDSEGVVVGLDYSVWRSHGAGNPKGSVLYRWCRAQQYGKAMVTNERNAAIRILNLQN